jgi:hypothetical protein
LAHRARRAARQRLRGACSLDIARAGAKQRNAALNIAYSPYGLVSHRFSSRAIIAATSSRLYMPFLFRFVSAFSPVLCVASLFYRFTHCHSAGLVLLSFRSLVCVLTAFGA